MPDNELDLKYGKLETTDLKTLVFKTQIIVKTTQGHVDRVMTGGQKNRYPKCNVIRK